MGVIHHLQVENRELALLFRPRVRREDRLSLLVRSQPKKGRIAWKFENSTLRAVFFLLLRRKMREILAGAPPLGGGSGRQARPYLPGKKV